MRWRPGRFLVSGLLCLVPLVLLLAQPGRVAAEECVTFPETKHQVCGRFLEYWRANGGLAQQGLPLTDVFNEVNPTNGQTYPTQYFERARFEYHQENQPPYDVLLGLLGREQFQAKYPQGAPAGLPAGGDCNAAQLPPGTKCINQQFTQYYLTHGALAQQGYALTDAFNEVNPTNGQTYLVQYFERARFEYHPENANTPYVILLGLLGREQFLAKYPSGTPGQPPAPPTPAPTWGPPLKPLAGGKHYADPAGRFAFDVPQNWIKANTGTGDIAFSTPLDHDPAILIVTVVDGAGSATIDLANSAVEDEAKSLPGYQPMSLDKVTVAGQPAYRRLFTAQDPGKQRLLYEMVYLVAGGKFHLLTFGTMPSLQSQLVPIFDGIAGSYTPGTAP